jgi:hypothetical protein
MEGMRVIIILQAENRYLRGGHTDKSGKGSGSLDIVDGRQTISTFLTHEATDFTPYVPRT